MYIANEKRKYLKEFKDKVNEIKALSWHCDVSNLRSDLDFEPKFDLPSGLRETVKWYKENKWL